MNESTTEEWIHRDSEEKSVSLAKAFTEGHKADVLKCVNGSALTEQRGDTVTAS